MILTSVPPTPFKSVLGNNFPEDGKHSTQGLGAFCKNSQRTKGRPCRSRQDQVKVMACTLDIV